MFILRYNDINNDNVLKAYRAAKYITIQELEQDKHLPVERRLRIMEIGFVLKESNFLEHSAGGMKITNEGRLHLLMTSPYIAYIAIFISILAVLIVELRKQ
jgi:hypothetical protein